MEDRAERRLTVVDGSGVGPDCTPDLWEPSMEYLPVLAGNAYAVAEFRSLRESLEDLRGDSGLRSLAIVSSENGEGKSYVAANLAVTLARKKGAKVLLVDGDVHAGLLHVALGASNQPGLAHYLRSRCRLSDVLQRGYVGAEVMRGTMERLSFIASGSGHGEWEIADMDVLRVMLKSLGLSYDWILIDTPSLSAGSDAVSIARVCDGTLFVAREGVTRFDAAGVALRELNNVLGVVMNGIQGRR